MDRSPPAHARAGQSTLSLRTSRKGSRAAHVLFSRWTSQCTSVRLVGAPDVSARSRCRVTGCGSGKGEKAEQKRRRARGYGLLATFVGLSALAASACNFVVHREERGQRDWASFPGGIARAHGEAREELYVPTAVDFPGDLEQPSNRRTTCARLAHGGEKMNLCSWELAPCSRASGPLFFHFLMYVRRCVHTVMVFVYGCWSKFLHPRSIILSQQTLL